MRTIAIATAVALAAFYSAAGHAEARQASRQQIARCQYETETLAGFWIQLERGEKLKAIAKSFEDAVDRELRMTLLMRAMSYQMIKAPSSVLYTEQAQCEYEVGKPVSPGGDAAD
ncbi:hypothetical protein [Burkholderia ubonensis]|uniref:hypothetical protein n=1 Tax=Burkholderia ubonensis TaxID=101571 RepID=UPI00075792DF|nr:hypothetical protein [Burkholderia ubonensis]KVT00040.1 hypothetical protein WK47_26300 [Burkholderia ubonensis]KVT12263.1 hypothetical protein WK46_03915 [Burkholderia ubonensis]KVT36837.1 hypothetical protein WK50_28775 [Burkholderia ubonensis]